MVPGQTFLWDGLLYGTVRLNGAAVAGAWRMLTTQILPRRTRAALLFRAVATSRNSPKFSSKVRPTVFSPISQSWRFEPHAQTSQSRLRIADHGRCACSHLHWEQARAVVGVWESRVGFSVHGANSTISQLRFFTATHTEAQAALRPPRSSSDSLVVPL